MQLIFKLGFTVVIASAVVLFYVTNKSDVHNTKNEHKDGVGKQKSQEHVEYSKSEEISIESQNEKQRHVDASRANTKEQASEHSPQQDNTHKQAEHIKENEGTKTHDENLDAGRKDVSNEDTVTEGSHADRNKKRQKTENLKTESPNSQTGGPQHTKKVDDEKKQTAQVELTQQQEKPEVK